MAVSVTQSGCAESPRQPAEAAAELEKFAVKRLPEEAQPTLVNLGGKVHLVGYQLDRDAVFSPGSTHDVKLYWRRVGPVEPGWRLFTHLLFINGKQAQNYDNLGDFRAAGAEPAGWKLGQIYEESFQFRIPTNLVGQEAALGVGVYRTLELPGPDGGKREIDSIRLQVLGGDNNGANVGIVTYLDTGLPKLQARAAAPKAE